MATPGNTDRAARLHALWHVPVGLVFTVGFTLCASGAPIVPVVIDGAYALMPRQRSWCAPGRVRVRILPPIDTTGLTRDGLAALAESLHDTYARTLAAMRATSPPSA